MLCNVNTVVHGRSDRHAPFVCMLQVHGKFEHAIVGLISVQVHIVSWIRLFFKWFKNI